MKVTDNLNDYDSSHDFLLGGKEHNNVIENENSRTVIKVTLHKSEVFHKDFFSKCDQIKGNCEFAQFNEKILNRKLHFLCSIN